MTSFLLFSLFFLETALGIEPVQSVPLPSSLKNRSVPQIKSIFSSLQNTYPQKRKTLWWLKIQQAFFLKEKEPAFFCNQMKELSENPEFPLYQLALLYFYETCPLKTIPSMEWNSFPTWLKPRVAKSFYRRYTKFKNEKELLSAILALITHTPLGDLKTSYLKQALSLAKKLKDPRVPSLQKQLFQLSPELIPKPTFKDYIPIAHSYRKKRIFKKSISFYRKALNSPSASFEEKNTCFKWLVKIYKLQRRHKKYALAGKQWSDWLIKQNTATAQKQRYRNQIRIAQYHWNGHRDQKALNILDQLLKESPPPLIQGEIHWLKGSIKLKITDAPIEEGLREFSESIRFLKQDGTNQELLEKVLWKQSWILRENGFLKKALQSFVELEALIQNPYTKSRLLFWKGQTLSDLKKPIEMMRTFNTLIREDPLGYYGLMATKKLKKDLKITINKDRNLVEDSNLDQESLLLISWLISLNETEVLKSFLKFKKKNLMKKKQKNLEDWKLFFSIQTLAKQYLNIFFTFRELRLRFQKYFLIHHIELLFPLEFEEEVQMVSKKWGVSKALILAIIRQESAFNPKARSPADALGLMQLIPSTARSIAIQIKKPYRGMTDLYDPLKNITLGTFYIKKLLKRYNQSFILSLSAYNAGGTPVKEWRSSLRKANPLEFIENIPYEETRVYVKLLMRNFIIYNAILKEEDSAFPNWIFKIDDKTI